MGMEVYRIQNIIDGKMYHGVTIYTFEKRYHKGRWWKRTDNIYLKRAAELYGPEKFKITILHKNIVDLDQLDALEQFYIKEFNSLVPNGYNFESGGRFPALHYETKVKLSKSTRKEGRIHKFRSPWGEIFEPDNIEELCRKYNLHSGCMCQLARGKTYENDNSYSHKGWTNADEPIEERSFVSPWGEVFTIQNIWGNIQRFNEKYNIDSRILPALWKGQLKIKDGWTKFPEGTILKTLISPSGERFTMCLRELKDFCIENNIAYKAIIEFWFNKERFPNHRGWKILKE